MEQVNKQNFVQKFLSGVFGNSNANVQQAAPQVTETYGSNLNTYNSLQGQVSNMRSTTAYDPARGGYCGNDPYRPGGPLNPTGGPINPFSPNGGPRPVPNFPTPFPFPNDFPNNPFDPIGPSGGPTPMPDFPSPWHNPINPQIDGGPGNWNTTDLNLSEINNSNVDDNTRTIQNIPDAFSPPLTYQATDGTIRSTEFLPFDTDRDGMIDHGLDGKPVYELPGIGLKPTAEELQTAIQNVLDTKLQETRPDLLLFYGISIDQARQDIEQSREASREEELLRRAQPAPITDPEEIKQIQQADWERKQRDEQLHPKTEVFHKRNGDVVFGRSIGEKTKWLKDPNIIEGDKYVADPNPNKDLLHVKMLKAQKTANDLMTQIYNERVNNIQRAAAFFSDPTRDDARRSIVDSAKARINQAYSQLMALPDFGTIPAIKAQASKTYNEIMLQK